LTDRLRNAAIEMAEVRQQNAEWSAKIAQANVTDQAVMKIVDDRFRVTFKQMKEYNMIQEEQIVEIAADMKKVLRIKDKLLSTLQELHSDRMRPNKFTCSRAKYLVQGIAKDIRIKEKKAGLSLTAKLRKNLESIETLRQDGNSADERMQLLLEQEKISKRELELLFERVPRLRMSARSVAKSLQSQSNRTTEKLVMFEDIFHECGQISVDQRSMMGSGPPKNGEYALSAEVSPLANIESLVKESYVVNDDFLSDWDDLGVVKIKEYAAYYQKALTRSEIVELVIDWQKIIPTIKERRGRRGSETESLEISCDVANVPSNVETKYVLSSILAGCYSAFGASYQRQRLVSAYLREQALLSGCAATENQKLPSTRSSKGFQVSQKHSNTIPKGPRNLDMSSILPLDLMQYSLIELCVVLARAVEGLADMKCCSSAFTARQVRTRLKELYRELNIPELSVGAQAELNSCTVNFLQDSIRHASTPLFIHNKRHLLARYQFHMLTLANCMIELSPTTVRTRWSKLNNIFAEEFSEIEHLSLRLTEVIYHTELMPPTGELELNVDGVRSARLHSAAQNDSARGIMSKVAMVMRELSEVISQRAVNDDGGAVGPSATPGFPNLQETMKFAAGQLLCIIEVAVGFVHASSDPRSATSVEVLDSLMRNYISEHGWHDGRRNDNHLATSYTIADRNTILCYQIFFLSLCSRELSRYGLLSYIIRAVRSGHRLLPTESGRFDPLLSYECKDSVFALDQDFMLTMSGLAPILWPAFLCLDSWRRVIEVDISRHSFLYRITQKPYFADLGLDLRHLAVSLSSDAQIALVQSHVVSPQLQQPVVARKKEDEIIVVRGQTAQALGVVVHPTKLTKISSHDHDVDRLHKQTQASGDVWVERGLMHLQQLCGKLADLLWDLYDTQEHGTVPIYPELKARTHLLQERLLRFCQKKESKMSRTSVQGLKKQFDQLLYEVIRNRGIVISAANAFVDPWKSRARWLRMQYRGLLTENDAGFLEIAQLRAAVGAVQDEITGYAQNLQKSHQRLKRIVPQMTKVPVQYKADASPIFTVGDVDGVDAGTSLQSQFTASSPASNSAVLLTQLRIEELKKLREKKLCQLKDLTDIERVRLESRAAIRIRSLTRTTQSIIDTAERLRTQMIITSDDDDDDVEANDDRDECLDMMEDNYVHPLTAADSRIRGVAVSTSAVELAQCVLATAVSNVLYAQLLYELNRSDCGVDNRVDGTCSAPPGYVPLDLNDEDIQCPQVVSLPAFSVVQSGIDGEDSLSDISFHTPSHAADEQSDDLAENDQKKFLRDGHVDAQEEQETPALQIIDTRESVFFSFLGDAQFEMFRPTADVKECDELVHVKVKYFAKHSSDELYIGSEDLANNGYSSQGLRYVTTLHPQFGDAFLVNSYVSSSHEGQRKNIVRLAGASLH
jgi:hypothetical protein